MALAADPPRPGGSGRPGQPHALSCRNCRNRHFDADFRSADPNDAQFSAGDPYRGGPPRPGGRDLRGWLGPPASPQPGKRCRGPSTSSPVRRALRISSSTSNWVRTGPGVSISFSSRMVRRREVKGTKDIAGTRGDHGLWQEAVRDVRPLRGARPANSAGLPREADAASARVEPAALHPHMPLPPLDRFAGIDRANAERLKRGLHRIEARLDLQE